MSIRCGWASWSEHKTANGTKGDQTGKEVKLGNWYSFGQTTVWRFKDKKLAEKYANKIVDACKNDHIGYGQNDRTSLYNRAKEKDFQIHKITKDCNCDCSSLTACCLIAVGIDVSPNNTTSTLNSALASTGNFTKLTGSKYTGTWANLQIGDIINDPGHHVISVVDYAKGTTSGGKTVDELDEDADDINNREKKEITAENFDIAIIDRKKLKYHTRNGYLTRDEMNDNAKYVCAYLYQKYGWTINAIAGILGNMVQESNINCGLWQSLKRNNMKGGYGLTQWTPATKYINWANEKGYSIKEMDGQLKRIQYEVDNKIQWIALSSYDKMSFKEFTKSTKSVAYLCEMFEACYERAGKPNMSKRIEEAEYYYEKLQDPKWWGSKTFNDSAFTDSDDNMIYTDEDILDTNDDEKDYNENDDGGYESGESGEVFADVQKSCYNLKQLGDNELLELKRCAYGDKVYIKHTFNKGKHYGTSLYGKKLTTNARPYIIKAVRKNGYLILKPKEDTNAKVIVNPKYIDWRKYNNDR